MNKFFISLLLLVLVGSFSSCKEKKELEKIDADIFLTKLKSSPSSIVPEESMPEWLVVRINEIEQRPVSVTTVHIYKGEWNKQIVYFIMDTFSSCLCDFFTENGEEIRDNLSDFYSTSKNWMLIYEYGESLEN